MRTFRTVLYLLERRQCFFNSPTIRAQPQVFSRASLKISFPISSKLHGGPGLVVVSSTSRSASPYIHSRIGRPSFIAIGRPSAVDNMVSSGIPIFE